MSLTEDEIIERRFVTKDVALVKVLNSFKVLANATTKELTDVRLNEFIKDITFWEYSLKNLRLTHHTKQREIANYDALKEQTEQDLLTAAASIAELKEVLEKEKKIRQQKEQYDLLGVEIGQLSSRADTNQQINDLRIEMEQLRGEEAAIQRELQDKSRQFGLLFHSLALLQPEPTKIEPSPDAAADGDTEMTTETA